MSHRFEGKHYLASYKDYDEYSPKMFMNKVNRGIKASGATILDSKVHMFENGGMTAIVLLSESHCSIHTYPEHRSMFVDLFTCGDCDPMKFHEVVTEYLKPKIVKFDIITRT